jgi:hypothetical protein
VIIMVDERIAQAEKAKRTADDEVRDLLTLVRRHGIHKITQWENAWLASKHNSGDPNSDDYLSLSQFIRVCADCEGH